MQVYPSQPAVSDWLLPAGFTLAFAWMLGASAYRLLQWQRTPSPLPIPLAPAPRTRRAVLLRLLLEVFTFRSLARASVPTWIASLLFHYGLLFILLMHLRFVLPHLPQLWIPLVVYSGWAALAMLVGLSVLLARRVLVDRLRYISAPSDYLHVILLLAIAMSGVGLRRLWPADVTAVGQFLRGALSLQWQPLPEGTALMVHVSLVIVLMLVFPLSKLLHGVGVVMSPTFNQRDAARQVGKDARTGTSSAAGSEQGQNERG